MNESKPSFCISKNMDEASIDRAVNAAFKAFDSQQKKVPPKPFSFTAPSAQPKRPMPKIKLLNADLTSLPNKNLNSESSWALAKRTSG